MFQALNQESLTKSTLLKVGAWITLITILVIVISYLHIYLKTEQQFLSQLEIYRYERSQNEFFSLVQDNHALLKSALLKRLEGSVQKEEGKGAFGNREKKPEIFADINTALRPLFMLEVIPDASKYSCVHIDKSLSLTTEIQQQARIFYELTTQYGMAWQNNFDSTYISTPNKITTIFRSTIPTTSTWCQNFIVDSSFSSEELSWLSGKQHNPNRTLAWSDVHYDPKVQTWQVSAITPVDDSQGNLIAFIGNDIKLNNFIERAIGQRLEYTHNLIFTKDGRLIVHPQLMDKIKDGAFNILDDGDAQLKHIFNLVNTTNVGSIVEDNENNQYLAITKIAGPDWYFVIVLPKSVFAKVTWQMAQFIIFLVVIALLMVLGILYVIMYKQITKPLNELLVATQRLGGHNNFDLRYHRNDELGCLADSFKAMVTILFDREQQLLDYANDLEKHTVALTHAKERAETANITKSQFIANMSHELRTPLNAIIGYSEMLQEDAVDLGEEYFVSDLGKIHLAGQHLLTLINDVLDISKIEAGKMEVYVETFDLLSMLDEVVSTIKPGIIKQGNKFEVQYGKNLGNMQADLTKIRQSLINLLSNASKFTEGGVITLAVNRKKEPDINDGAVGEGDWIEFSISDTGIGISEQQKNKIFQAFSQADASTTRKYGGTGLGLVITKRFTEIMGGTINVESKFGHGSTFKICLPTNIATQKASQNTAKSTSDQPIQQTILVIDDDPAVRELFKNYLIKQNYRIASAGGGDEGLRLARKIRPDAIILDVMMPGMDGWMVLSAIKTDPALANIPVIMASILEDKQLGYSLGATDYLVKPVNREQLNSVLNKYCTGNQNNHYIMIIEDEPTTRQMMETMINKAGWQVSSAENGRIGLEKIAIKQPDLILLDLMMPEMDGFEFVTHLREREEWRTIPVVVLTAKDITLEDRAKLNNCVQTVFQKGSYKREQLLREIKESLER